MELTRADKRRIAEFKRIAIEAVSDYLSKRGRAGNKARNKSLSAAQRKRIARKAARTRWSKTRRKP